MSREEFLARTPADGACLIRVPGAVQSLLEDGEVAALLRRYSDAALCEHFRPCTGEEVAEFRDNILADPKALRAELAKDVLIDQ